MDDAEARALAARLEALLQQLESSADPAVGSTATEAVQTLLALYGEGLARIMALAAGQGGKGIVEAIAADELLAHLLLLHGLHPQSLETRVLHALEAVRPYLESHGGDVELRGVEDGVARLRLQGSCHGCPSSSATLKLAIEEAIERAAPDLERLEVEGVTPAPGPQPLLFFDTAPASHAGGPAAAG